MDIYYSADISYYDKSRWLGGCLMVLNKHYDVFKNLDRIACADRYYNLGILHCTSGNTELFQAGKKCLWRALLLHKHQKHVLFFILSFLLESQFKIEKIAMIICVNVFAWLGGFVTPGAPGGLGVREALLTMLLPDMLPKVFIIGGVAIFRIITLFGEVLALCIATWFFIDPSEKGTQNG